MGIWAPAPHPTHPVRVARFGPIHISPRAGSMAAMFAGAILVGSVTIASKAALTDIGPITLAFGRFAVALAVFLCLCARAGVRPDLGRMPAALGASGVTVAFILQNLGLELTSALDATLIIEGSVPIVTAILGARMLGERATPTRLAGLALAVGGVAVVLLRGGGGEGSFSLAGALFSLGAGVSFSVYTVLGRRAFGGGVSLQVLTGSI